MVLTNKLPSPSARSKLPAPARHSPLSAGLFLWGRSATRWLPGELDSELRRASLTCQILPAFPAVLQRVEYDALVGSTSGKLRDAGAPGAIVGDEMTSPGNGNNAIDVGWSPRPSFSGLFRRNSIGEDFRSSFSNTSSADAETSHAQTSPDQTTGSGLSPRKLKALAKRSLSFRVTGLPRMRKSSAESPGPSNKALVSLIQEINPVSTETSESTQGGEQDGGSNEDSVPDKGHDNFVRQDRHRVVWGLPTGQVVNDKLRRQLMMDRVGALARSLGRPDNGMTRVKKEDDQGEITDLNEMMSYALGEKQKKSPQKQGWMYFCYLRIKNRIEGKPEKTAYTILLTIATLIALIGYDAYYCLSDSPANDDKMLTIIFCVICMFIIEFYSNCMYDMLYQDAHCEILCPHVVYKLTFWRNVQLHHYVYRVFLFLPRRTCHHWLGA